VHVTDGVRKICKYWLRENQVILADSSGFTRKELAKVESTIKESYETILTTFNEYCKGYKK
jgi:hypothetical protein